MTRWRTDFFAVALLLATSKGRMDLFKFQFSTVLFILMMFSWVAYDLIVHSLGDMPGQLEVMIKIATSCTWDGQEILQRYQKGIE